MFVRCSNSNSDILVAPH